MNTSGEVADLMVKEGLMITEEVVKLTGLGAKNLAAIVIALLKEDNKLQGKTNLKKLLKSDKPLCILQIKESDIGKFNSEAKKYGVLFTAVNDKSNDTGLCDIIAKQDDVTKLNYIMEKLGYAAPEQEIEPEPEPEKKEPENEPDKDAPDKQKDEHSKKPFPRAKENQQESESMKHGDSDKTDNRTNGKPSVKQKVEDIKAEQNKQKAEKAQEKKHEHTQPKNKKKKKKSKKKGRNR